MQQIMQYFETAGGRDLFGTKKEPEIRFNGFIGEWEEKRLRDCGKTYS